MHFDDRSQISPTLNIQLPLDVNFEDRQFSSHVRIFTHLVEIQCLQKAKGCLQFFPIFVRIQKEGPEEGGPQNGEIQTTDERCGKEIHEGWCYSQKVGEKSEEAWQVVPRRSRQQWRGKRLFIYLFFSCAKNRNIG